MLNPTEAFGNVMVETEYVQSTLSFKQYSSVQISCKLIDLLVFRYVECTASAIQALVLFRSLHPGYRSKEIAASVARASSYIEDEQMSDGSW